MGFPGTWMTESENAVYRVIPKCACSSIGQILYYSDHGSYFDGDIHDAKEGIHKWAFEQRFLLFARDTIRFKKPIDPDIHWSAVSGHASTLVRGGGRYNLIISTEDFKAGMAEVLKGFEQKHPVDLDNVPRFNESEGHGPKRLHPIEDYFDDLSIHLTHEIYRRDFNLFNYDKHPYSGPPVKEIDLDFVHAKLGK